MKFNVAGAIFSLALATSAVQAQKPKILSGSECRKIFLPSDDYQNRRMADGSPYCEVYWDRDDDPRELFGYVFLNTLSLADNEIELLIGIDVKGKIVKVKAKAGTVATEEFFSQFEGRSLNASFDVAKTAEDLLYLPSKIKALKDNLEMSERIAGAVHEVMLSANHSLALAAVK